MMFLATKAGFDMLDPSNGLKSLPMTQHLFTFLVTILPLVWICVMAISATETLSKESKQPQQHPFLRSLIYVGVPVAIAVTARNLLVMWAIHTTHDMSYSVFLLLFSAFISVSLILTWMMGKAFGIMTAQFVTLRQTTKELIDNGKHDRN